MHRNELRAYSLGTLGWDSATVVEGHLKECATCQSVLETLESDADGLIVGLRRAGHQDSCPQEPQLDRLIARARKARATTRSARNGITSWGSDRLDDERFDESRLVGAAGSSVSEPAMDGDVGRVPTSADELTEYLLESGLYSKEELDRILEDVPQEALLQEPMALARWLVEQQYLTCFQAAELCLGRPYRLQLGRNSLLEEIGRGGMGCVYKAHNVPMDRVVAIKVLAPRRFAHADMQERFRRETRAIAALSHPHVVTAYDAGQQSETQYLVMEFVSGTDLGRLVRRYGPLPWGRAVQYVCQAARGLAAAHDQGIVHRDVKPGNLLVSMKGNVKVSDLGLARFLASTESHDDLTGTGQVMGTVDYMSPEQAFDVEHVDERSDIYSLGWTLFYLLTGEIPYPESSALGKLQVHRDGPIPSLRAMGLEVPEELDRLFQRMVAKRPDDRPPTMYEVADELTNLPYEETPIELPAGIAHTRRPDLDTFFAHLAIQARRARVEQERQPHTVPHSRSVPLSKVMWRTAIATGVVAVTLLAMAAYSFFARPLVPMHGEVLVQVDDADAEELEVRVLQNQEPEVPRAREAAGLFGQIGQIQLPQRASVLVLSPDKSVAYVGCGDNCVYVIELATETIARKLAGHEKPIIDMAVSHDGTRLATCSGDRTIRIWDLKTDDPVCRIRLPVTPWRVVFAPDDQAVLVALHVKAPTRRFAGTPAEHRNFRSLMLFDVDSGRVVRELTEDRETFYWSIAFSPEGGLIAAGSQQGEIVLIESATGEVTQHFNARPGPAHCLVFSEDGKRLYFGNALFVVCRSIADGKLLYRRGLQHGITGLDVNSEESRFLAEGTMDVRVVEMETAGAEALTNLHGHTSPVSGLLFLADEDQAISSGWDGTVRIWQLPAQAGGEAQYR